MIFISPHLITGRILYLQSTICGAENQIQKKTAPLSLAGKGVVLKVVGGGILRVKIDERVNWQRKIIRRSRPMVG